MGKRTSGINHTIHRSLSRLPCGRGMFFVEDVPFFDEIFPIVNQSNPRLVRGMIMVNLSYDEDGYKDWSITYYHTAYMKGMVTQTKYAPPDIPLLEPANRDPRMASVFTPKSVKNRFQIMAMGNPDIVGYPLIVNHLDYLHQAIDDTESHLDEIIAGLGMHIRDYLKTAYNSGDGITSDRIDQLSDLADLLNEAEPHDFAFDICIPAGLLAKNERGYYVMPRTSKSNPFSNMDQDYYLDDIPPHIQTRALGGKKRACDDYGLNLQCYYEQLEVETRRLIEKYTRPDRHTPSVFCRHRKRKTP